MERAVVMGNGKAIMPEDLPHCHKKEIIRFILAHGAFLQEAMDWFKKEYILLNLKQTGGNRSRAAEKLDIQRTYLSRLISKYKIKD